jgi:hypothetical protein
MGDKASTVPTGDSTYGEIDQIDASEIDPNYHDDTEKDAPSESDASTH